MDDETSNAGENRSYRGQFTRNDPRINRKGRPKTFEALRKLAVLVAAEQDEAGINRALEILRDWAKSKEPVKQAKFLEYAFGKVPERIEQDGEIKVIVEYAENNPPKTP